MAGNYQIISSTFPFVNSFFLNFYRFSAVFPAFQHVPARPPQTARPFFCPSNRRFPEKNAQKTQSEQQYGQIGKIISQKSLRNGFFCFIMAHVRESGLWLKADASRRQSGPRKSDKALMSMVRFRCQSGRDSSRESGVRARQAQSNAPVGGCGVKDQVSRSL